MTLSALMAAGCADRVESSRSARHDRSATTTVQTSSTTNARDAEASLGQSLSAQPTEPSLQPVPAGDLGTTGDVQIGVLTPDHAASAQVTVRGTDVTVSDTSSVGRGSNLRLALLPTTGEIGPDQQVCATWSGPAAEPVQPGVVLRASVDLDGRARALTVSNNIVWGMRGSFNVHVMGSTGDDIELRQVGQIDLTHAVKAAPPPWRICARIVSDVVAVRLWPTSMPEPAWSDSHFSATVVLSETELPQGGRAGIYVGHVPGGVSTTFSDLTVSEG